MKKFRIILLVMLCILSLKAEVVTVVPYSGVLGFDNNSSKNSGSINGFYASSGTLSYLLEFSYTYTDIKYKSSTDNLTQNEYTFIYNRYWNDHAVKVGIHTNSTTDKSLKNGTTLIIGTSKWKWFGYSKLTYGLDYYNTSYVNGEDLADNNHSVIVDQISPYISYYKPFSLSTKNLISLKINIENINAYSEQKDYISYELKDTLYYKKAYLEIAYIGGELRTGIKDGGMTVYNSKDLITNAISAKLGFYINSKLNTSLSYTSTTYDEYNNIDNINSSALVMTASYTF